MNLFFYTFFEIALSSPYILWTAYLTFLCLIYILVIRLFVGHKSQHELKKNLFTGRIFKKIKFQRMSVSQSEKMRLKKLFHLYEQADLPISWAFLKFILVASLLITFLWGVIILKSVLLFLLLSFFVSVIFYLFLVVKKEKRKKKMVEQLPSFLQAMASTLQAGYSIPNALEFLENEVENPLQNEIKRINRKRILRISLEKSLEDFAKIVNHPDIYFFAESTIIQLKTGGNLIKLFKKISTLIEEKLKLERDMKSFTSQGKLSGILVALLWPISLSFFYFFSPQHTDILFHTSAGKGILIFSLFLEGMGFFFIWRIVKVRF